MTTTTLTTAPSPWPTGARAKIQPVRYADRQMAQVSCVGGCTVPGHRPVVTTEIEAPQVAYRLDVDHAAQSLQPATEAAA